jgi:hypothetical protein
MAENFFVHDERSFSLHDEFSSLFGYGRQHSDKDDVRDKRSVPRIRDHSFVFLHLNDTERRQAVQAVTNDISSGGLCIDTTVQVRPGDLFSVEMYAPLDYHKRVLESMYVKTEVAWVKEISSDADSNRFRVGLAYKEIAGNDREKLSRYVENGVVDRRY